MTESDRSAFAVDRTVARRDFLKTAAWATAAISAAGITGFGLASQKALAVHEGYVEAGPLAILQFAYQLELLEGTFYDQGVNAGLFAEPALSQIVALRDHEMAHADALADAIVASGGEVPATPTFTYPDGVFEDQVAFLDLAATFEPVGVGAYQGAAPALIGNEYLGAALSIHNAEAQHVVGINILQGIVPPANTAFTEALELAAVQEAVAPFGL
ncbi:ferritin-like domain-containing protein [Rubrobacter indicoceani]|uniref:ferritin-like domain-containing protein n=1 Tax=Rubrobacter indicoceani TaxID=2051957 RepID=UPI000E5B7EFB|nr:ferritin-like domain-containing protein [Rubrobacter indicoceani]